MCVSSCLNIIFSLLLTVSTIILLAATFTPSWSEQTLPSEITDAAKAVNVETNVEQIKIQRGLLTCSGYTSCKDSFKNRPDWEKAVVACFILALLFCFLAFVWSCVACFACCCKSCLAPPLPIFTGLATLLSLIGIVIFAVKTKASLEDVKGLSFSDIAGYSLYIAIVAMLGLFLTTIVGVIYAKVSKVAPL